MKKYKFLPLVLLCFLFLSIPLAGTVKAQTTPSYVGINEGDQYTWSMKMSQAGLNQFMADIESMKDDFKTSLGTYGSLTFPNMMESIIKDAINNFGLLPSGWTELNITELFEGTIDHYIEILNYSLLNIPPDWKSLNITSFKDVIIEGFNSTYPGFEEMNFYEVLDLIFSELASAGLEILPSGWQDYKLIDFIQWELNNFLNDTILFGMIPDGWETFNMSQFMGGIIPGLKSEFIDFIIYIAQSFDDVPMMLNLTMYNYLSLGLNETMPEEYLDYNLYQFVNMSMMMANESTGMIPDGYETLDISSLLDEVLFYLNNSGMAPGILDYNMSYFIDMAKYGINMSLPSEISDLNMDELIDIMISEMVSGVNSSGIYEVIPNWNLIPVNQLIDELYDLLESGYDGMVNYLDVSGFFVGFRLRFNITDISSEQSYGDLNYVLVNFSLEYDPGIGQFTQIPPDSIDDFLPFYPLAIIDPSSIPDPIKGLAEQAKHSFCLFIAKTFDTSKITFKDMTLDLSPFSSLDIHMNWNSDGVLMNAKVDYGGQNLASVQEAAVIPPSGIPGFSILSIIGFSIVGLIGVIYSVKKKRK
ncbi:MAG: hypothetical protein EU548_09925 [Promethearchaeota archaeon]|nr:MAG: hypothetical protein EU548_09925 [Candidatus Lokiarchaeota archaeon]